MSEPLRDAKVTLRIDTAAAKRELEQLRQEKERAERQTRPRASSRAPAPTAPERSRETTESATGEGTGTGSSEILRRVQQRVRADRVVNAAGRIAGSVGVGAGATVAAGALAFGLAELTEEFGPAAGAALGLPEQAQSVIDTLSRLVTEGRSLISGLVRAKDEVEGIALARAIARGRDAEFGDLGEAFLDRYAIARRDVQLEGYRKRLAQRAVGDAINQQATELAAPLLREMRETATGFGGR